MRDLVCIQTAMNRLTDAVEQIDLTIAIQRLGDDLSCFQGPVEKQCKAVVQTTQHTLYRWGPAGVAANTCNQRSYELGLDRHRLEDEVTGMDGPTPAGLSVQPL